MVESGSVERLAKNESFFRQVNERIKDVADGFEGTQAYEFLCECSDPRCTERIQLTRAEYEAVRANPGSEYVVTVGEDVLGVLRVADVVQVLESRGPSR